MLSDYDIQGFSNIVAGHGDWFEAQLIRLIAKADNQNLAKLRKGFPEEVQVYEDWYFSRGIFAKEVASTSTE